MSWRWIHGITVVLMIANAAMWGASVTMRVIVGGGWPWWLLAVTSLILVASTILHLVGYGRIVARMDTPGSYGHHPN